ncbi:HAD-IA family hydrolase [Sinorhizobium meliloti]|uniref:HAD-IA family hydrolase n=1 Tax=Rhizobium meliloti TaxID=382 RepID=UPI0002E46A3E|nr:HAD-IA family hydrolase [Sinorhizobium meliloti]MDE3761380.1 HAD-IA family hydrolase [Sinorhizobium meliloti]
MSGLSNGKDTATNLEDPILLTLPSANHLLVMTLMLHKVGDLKEALAPWVFQAKKEKSQTMSLPHFPPAKLIIFDCDGVLIDSEFLGCRVVSEALATIGCHIPVEEVVRRFTGISFVEMCRILRADYGVNPPAELENRIKNNVEAAFHTELKIIKGAANFVSSLGIPYCVASSSAPAKLRLGLAITGLLEAFEPNIFSATMVPQGKPAPDIFLHAAEKMGVAPCDAVVVEDSVAGVTAGVRAGMRVIGFVGGSHCGPDHAAMLEQAGAQLVVSDLAEMFSLLDLTPRVTNIQKSKPEPTLMSKTLKPVKVAVVGAGVWGANHALALTSYAPAELSVICDLDESRAKAAAERFGCGWSTNLDEVLASDVEVVTIATPDHLHRDPAVAALHAGKHVLIEKPIATTVSDAKAILAAEQKGGGMLMVDFHARWHPLFMGAKSYAESGKLGKSVMGYARLSDTIWVPTKMLGWGARSGPEWFLMPHMMDVVRWLIQEEPREVYAKGSRGVLKGRGIDCFDTIQSMITFENDAVFTLESSWILPESYSNVVDQRLTLYGTEGGLDLRNEPNLWVYTDKFHTPFSSETLTRYGKAWGFQYEPIRYFVDCVAARIRPEATGFDGLVVTAMIEATLMSIAEKRPVMMDEVLGDFGQLGIRKKFA